MQNGFIQKSKMFALQNLGNHFAVNNICFTVCEVQSRNLFPESNLQKNSIYSVLHWTIFWISLSITMLSLIPDVHYLTDNTNLLYSGESIKEIKRLILKLKKHNG